MRWATIQSGGGPRVCAHWDGSYVDLASIDPGFPSSTREILALGKEATRRADELLRSSAFSRAVRFRPENAHFLPPIPDPPKIVCLGLNYRDHAAESGMPIPEEPVLFSKYATTLVGHGGEIVLPQESSEVDFEAELVFAIGKGGRNIPRVDAYEHVGGYIVGHDVSARDWQLNKPGKQWLAGKTFDTFAPMGPDLVTPDEVPDPHSLGISLQLNDRIMQKSNTSQMIFRIDEVIAYVSKIFTLEVGDLFFTGTPPGVGMARKPPVWLQPGDVVEVSIEKLGSLRNLIVRH
jgi:2-keto-4-pentenoate hydratase/2-oxohepta-3-ene-1,7-dioic acid hydratase in catechol pathway